MGWGKGGQGEVPEDVLTFHGNSISEEGRSLWSIESARLAIKGFWGVAGKNQRLDLITLRTCTVSKLIMEPRGWKR